MPFKSEAQRRYLWANEPEIARDWTDTYGSKIHAADGGIMRLPFGNGKGVDYADNDIMVKVELLREQYPDKYHEDMVSDEEMVEMVKANEGEEIGDDTSWYNQPTLERMWNDPDRPQISKGLGTMKDWATDKIGSGINWGKQLPGMAMGALSGVPGLGFLINNMRSDPRDQFLGDPYSMQNYKGPNYGYGNALRHGNLTGQDQFGINTRSLLGNYQGHYGNFMNDYLAGNINKNKFNKNKFAFAQDVTGTADDSSNITGTPLVTQASIHRGGGNQGNRGSFTGAHPDTPSKSPEQGGWHPGAKDGGIIGLWPR